MRRRYAALGCSVTVLALAAACGPRREGKSTAEDGWTVSTGSSEVRVLPPTEPDPAGSAGLEPAGSGSGTAASSAGEATPATLELSGLVSLAAPPAAVPAAQLGACRREIEARTGQAASSGVAGWLVHGPGWALRYENDRAVELVARVAPGLSCEEAARLLGFATAGYSLLRADRCAWPGISSKHVLGPDVAGELDLRTGQFTVRWQGKATPCAQP